MQFTVEQISVMRQHGQLTSNQTDAPAPVFYSNGAVQDFRSKGLKAMWWNFVDQYKRLPQLHEYVRCILCNAKANKDGISRPRRVFGLHCSKLVSAQKYRYPNCPAAGGKAVTYDAKHPDVMARLPAFLAAQLPITFTQSGAVVDDMLQHIHHDVMKGLSFQAACDRAAAFCGATTTRLSWSSCHCGTISSSLAPRQCWTVQHCLGRLPNLGLLAVQATPSLTYQAASML